MKSHSIDELLEIYSTTLGYLVDDLDINEPLNLDSIQMLMFISTLESEFEVSFNLEKINEDTSMNDIYKLLSIFK